MLHCARVFAAALAAILLAIEGVAAAEPLSTLLGQIAPAKTPEGSVDVVGWVERDGTLEPSSLFVPRRDRTAEAAVAGSFDGADAVLVTREPRGGSPGDKIFLP